jgi:Protein kinase domain
MTSAGGRPPGPRPKTWGQWTDLGPISPDVKHVRRVAHVDGRPGLLKMSRRTSKTALARFEDEARESWALRAESGVVKLLDVDTSAQPRWFVMEEVVPLRGYLGNAPDLRDVIAMMLPIAATLSKLATNGIFHRDIKPDNLFALDDQGIVGDWGIGAFPNRSMVTRIGEGVGPAHFIAPEMRSYAPGIDFGRADVYSLAKTLFVLALPERGPYPPPGQHQVGAEEFSLYRAGQRDGHEIEALLAAATAAHPGSRPAMIRFHRELNDWLRLTPLGGARRAPQPAFRIGFGPEMDVEFALLERRAKDLKAKMWAAGRELAAALAIDKDDFGWSPRKRCLTGDYGFDPDSDYEPDDFVSWSSKYQPNGTRAVIATELMGSTVTLYAECQKRRGRHKGSVVWNCDPPIVAEVELPGTRARVHELVGRLTTEMMKQA